MLGKLIQKLKKAKERKGRHEFVVDYTSLEEADCEINSTCYYGGEVTVTEISNHKPTQVHKILGHGTDRGDNQYDSVSELIEGSLEEAINGCWGRKFRVIIEEV